MTGLQMPRSEQKRIAARVVYLRDKLGLDFYIIARRFGLSSSTIEGIYQRKKKSKRGEE